MQGELMPPGRHYRKSDPKKLQKIREGGVKADIIHQKAEEQHKAEEVPAAEEQLMKDLKNL